MTGIPQAQMKRGGLREHVGVLRNIARESLRAGTADGEQLKQSIDQYLADYGPKDEENQ
ncbi:hypothetical protein D3C72_2548460 [compost metagenome]